MLQLDLFLAIVHHLAAFALLGVLAAQYALVGGSVDASRSRRLAGLDLGYGLLALTLLVVGFARATLAAKGWPFYAQNLAFWAKVALFATIGLLSIRPTLAFRRWRTAGGSAGPEEVGAVRRTIGLELALFAGLPILAAMMARGIGQI